MSQSTSLKSKGYQGEKIVKDAYLAQGYVLLHQNRTIPGGEIDLVLESTEDIVFVEVKTVDHIAELDNYLTQKKLKTLERTIESYLIQYPNAKNIRLDVAFVQH